MRHARDRVVHPVERAQERALAAAAGTDEGQDLVGVDLDVDVLDGHLLAITDAQTPGPHLDLGLRARRKRRRCGAHGGDCGQPGEVLSCLSCDVRVTETAHSRRPPHAALRRESRAPRRAFGVRRDGDDLGAPLHREGVATPLDAAARTGARPAEERHVRSDQLERDVARGAATSRAERRTATCAAAVCTRHVPPRTTAVTLSGASAKPARRHHDGGHDRLDAERQGVECSAASWTSACAARGARHGAADVAVLDGVERRPCMKAGVEEAAAERVVLGQDLAHGPEPTEACEVAPADRHRLADRERPVASPRPARRARATCARRSAGSRARRPACARRCPQNRLVTMPTRSSASSPDERPEIAGLHADVGVGDDVDVARGRALEADELRDLRVDGRVGIGEDHARVEPRVPRDEAPRDRIRRVRRARRRRGAARTRGSRCGRTTRGWPRGRRRCPASGLRMVTRGARSIRADRVRSRDGRACRARTAASS